MEFTNYDDAHEFDEEEYWEGEECGRWQNGALVTQCLNAGTEFCDFDCPIGIGGTE